MDKGGSEGLLEKALKDFRAARSSASEGMYDVAYLAARQAAEDALGAAAAAIGLSAEGKGLEGLLEELGGRYDLKELRRAARDLEIGAEEGASYGPMAAARAIARAEQFILWAREVVKAPKR